jgi:hypothetical protein
MAAADELIRELQRVDRLQSELHDPQSRKALSSYATEIKIRLDELLRAKPTFHPLQEADLRIAEGSTVRG